MIPKTDAAVQTYSSTDTLISSDAVALGSNKGANELKSWQKILAQSAIKPADLLSRLGLPNNDLIGMQSAHRDFQLRVPEPFLKRIQPGNLNDPLLLQILPQLAETQATPGYVTDPLGENAANPQQGIIHKYHGRVLLVISGGCAINCRYCFRRHFPYEDNNIGKSQWQEVLSYLTADTSIKEVIFSGGDPLATSDQRLLPMLKDLEQIPHLQRLRIHSRLPVVIPQRVTPELLAALKRNRLQTVLVNHINHAQEIDTDVEAAMAALKQANITLLNQSVLLKNINDNTDTLTELSERLFGLGVLPYYLHLLDPVAGASHFDVPEATAKKLVGELCDRLPGYMVPKLVKEIAGASAKVPVLPELRSLGINSLGAEDDPR